ncbi:hypothetical protein MKW98_019085 [Papaver atlanticum]|uniref:FBD domain-containing protein n=1 Tax=Papaver atlanticum TaxID=357466 RepID=A0AAD4TG95_9MAGN|nr:hypothetical protein MKW98_019085 [Papaver atlanticum]
MYTLPPCIFPHPSVSQLILTGCKLVSSFYKSFTSVKIPKLTSVELQKDSVYDLVSKCPCLEELHLLHCKIPSPFFELNVPKSNLKCLVFQSCVSNEWFDSLKHASIHIPTLLKLKYQGSFRSGYLSLYNSENIVEAEIDIYSSPHNKQKLLCKLLMDLQSVKSLTLFSVKLEVLNRNGGISLLAPLNNLRHLTVTVKLGQADKELLGLMCLLRSSPNLETLSIDFHRDLETEDEMLSTVYNVDEEAVRQLHLLSSECVAHLMKIKINDFLGTKVEMEFVEHILRSSLCLKEMVICIRTRYYLNFAIRTEHYEALKKKSIASLLACTRASPDARILIEGDHTY